MVCTWITKSIGIQGLEKFSKSNNEEDWVVEVNKPIKTGKGKEEFIKDYKLSRYICYLIVQNADPSKEVVALGQTYFAIQTRKQEITEQEYDYLSDDEKRFYQRKLTKQGNYTLQRVASAAVTQVWKYIGELIFNMLVLVGTIKISDRVVREMMGL